MLRRLTSKLRLLKKYATWCIVIWAVAAFAGAIPYPDWALETLYSPLPWTQLAPTTILRGCSNFLAGRQLDFGWITIKCIKKGCYIKLWFIWWIHCHVGHLTESRSCSFYLVPNFWSISFKINSAAPNRILLALNTFNLKLTKCVIPSS